MIKCADEKPYKVKALTLGVLVYLPERPRPPTFLARDRGGWRMKIYVYLKIARVLVNYWCGGGMPGWIGQFL